jgi:hypothetical protein
MVGLQLVHQIGTTINMAHLHHHHHSHQLLIPIATNTMAQNVWFVHIDFISEPMVNALQ